MGHTHHHGHRHGAEAGARLAFSIALNVVITVAQVVGGLLSGSLALLSDALHNFSDASSLGISYVARRIARKDASARRTFGYGRAEIIAAFVNLITLVLVAVLLMKEAVERLLDPQPVDGIVMMAVAGIGLAANTLTALLLFRESKESLNIRSAFLHVVSDAVASVGVIAGGLLIWLYDFHAVDPIVTFGISVYILYHSYAMLRQTVDILMESTPDGLSLPALIGEVERVEDVVDVHHVHVWQLDEHHLALEAHVVIDEDQAGQMERIKQEIKDLLARSYHISHSTLEFELAPCSEGGHAHCYGEHSHAQAEAH